jgi:phosphoenolpyruvate-protein kinase (PTS system EI component)
LKTNKQIHNCTRIYGNIALGKIVYFNNKQLTIGFTLKQLDELFIEIESIKDDDFIQYGDVHKRFSLSFAGNESIMEFVYPVFDSEEVQRQFKRLVYIEKMNISEAFEEAIEQYLFITKDIVPYFYRDRKSEIYLEIDLCKKRLMTRFEVMQLQYLIKNQQDNFILVTNDFKREYFYNLPTSIQGIICKEVTDFESARSISDVYELPMVVHNHTYLDGEIVIIDATRELTIINPQDSDTNFYKKELRNFTFELGEMATFGQSKVNLYAPLVDTRTLDKITSGGWYSGVAPFKSEYMYVTKGMTPTFSEQEAVFIKLLNAMQEKEIYIRIPDFRPERPIHYIEDIYTDIDSLINYYELYNVNLMAIASAVQETKMEVNIVIPMIRMSSEIPFWREAVDAAFEMYNQKTPKIGIMMETESALQYHEEYDKMDFVIIGLNDLIEELSDDFNRYSELSKEEIVDLLWPDIRDLHQHLRSYSMKLKHIVGGNFLKNPEVFNKFLKSGFTDFSIPLNAIGLIEETLKQHVESKGKFIGIAAQRIEDQKERDAQGAPIELSRLEINAAKAKSSLEKKAKKQKEIRDSHKEKREAVISTILTKKKKKDDDDKNK